MTQTGYANAVVNAMLGWLKGFANWVLRLFNLSGGVSPLTFLANHWKGILIVLLIIGVALDLIIWLVRWRPHWVWFGKKRIVINDKNFFKDADDEDSRSSNAPNVRPKRDWQENDFVVRSDVSREREAKKRRRRGDSQSAAEPRHTDVFRDEEFNVNAKQRFSDKYEDEVFNVANLPGAKAGGRNPETGEKT